MANTTISITDGTDALSKHLLNIAELEKNTEYSKLAYCNKVDVGNTQDGKPFFKFQLFDKGGHPITGRLFNIENVESKGAIANNIAGKVVKITFMLSVFNSIESLTLKTIDPVPEHAMSCEEFIGELKNIDEYRNNIIETLNSCTLPYQSVKKLITQYSLLEGIETVTMPDMWAERKGGAIKFTSMLLDMARAIFNKDEVDKALTIIILADIFMYWKYASNYEETVLSLGDNINAILAKSDKYIDGIYKASERNNNVEEQNICKEVKHLLRCYFGFSKPESYMSMVICNLRETLISKIEFESVHETMISGTYKMLQNKDGSFTRMVKL